MSDSAGELAPVFDAERSFLWGLSYRLTGSAFDADDVVQETFVRAIERPPRDRTRPWRPWLTRVALNVGRDLLRGAGHAEITLQPPVAQAEGHQR